MKKLTILLDSISRVKEFNNIVMLCPYDVDLSADRYVIDAKSIMGIFSIDLSKPVELQIHSNQCDDLIQKLAPFLVK